MRTWIWLTSAEWVGKKKYSPLTSLKHAMLMFRVQFLVGKIIIVHCNLTTDTNQNEGKSRPDAFSIWFNWIWPLPYKGCLRLWELQHLWFLKQLGELRFVSSLYLELHLFSLFCIRCCAADLQILTASLPWCDKWDSQLIT